ncbi:hypothetical protein MYX75_02170, partial [Acidobacteria bacterium AH-259-A15]|nr:hypothetical protein [Acidobacteria bacterium AH-259-A15]
SGLTFQPALSPNGQLMAYASDRSGEGNLDIWVQQVAGGGPIRVTNHEADDLEPNFSPDGSQIAFRSQREGGGIYVISALGGDARLITKGGRNPRFSPDGKRVAYWVGPEFWHTGDLYVVASTGGPPRELQQGRSPIWSPDGKHLLFVQRLGSAPESNWWVRPLDGGEAIRTGALEIFRRQGLEPEPGRLVFTPQIWLADTHDVIFSARLGDSTNLWKVPISTTTWQIAGPAERLTLGTGIENQASLAESGQLVFTSLNQNFDLWSLPIDANQGKVVGEIQQVTANAAADHSPSISADGSKLIFASNRSGNWDVWTKDLESGKATALTAKELNELNPIIKTDGSKVAYRVSQESPSFANSVYVMAPGEGLAEKVCDDCGTITDWSSDGENILYYYSSVPGVARTALLNLVSGEKIDWVQNDEGNVFDPRFSPDDRWIAFHVTQRLDRVRRQLFIAPFRSGVVPKQSEWIAVTDGSGSDARAAWSPDGNVLYFLSDRDGWRCIWAQRLDAGTKRPLGSALEVYHSHDVRRSLGNFLSYYKIGLAVARDKVVFSMGELTGNIWMMGSSTE